MQGRHDRRVRPKTPADAIHEARLEGGLPATVATPGAPYPVPRALPVDDDAFTLAIGDLAGTEVELDRMQDQLDDLHSEINGLRRRDETLKFYMTRLDEELRLAAKLQQDFLPKVLPQIGPVFFHTLFRPCGYVSGDLYDVMRLDERHVGFFLVDAVGHGMPAALLTMFIKRALVCKEIDVTGYHVLDPGETMRRLNDALIEQNLSQATFCTAIYGIIDVETLQVTVASGGHPKPLLVRSGVSSEVNAEGPLLGIFEKETFTAATVQLQPGDRLIVYSDGIEVSFNEDLANNAGAWRRELDRLATLPAEGMLIQFAEQIDREIGSLSPRDDLTLLVLEVK